LKAKLNILLIFICVLLFNNSYANEKFVKVKGNLVTGSLNQAVTNFEVKVVLDELDSTITLFDDDEFEVWLPANRKAKVYFIKEGYDKIYLLVDASFIPSFAYKKKQLIELVVKITQTNNVKGRKKLDEPFCTANFKASVTQFILKFPEEEKKQIHSNFKPLFSSPINTYKGAKPNNINLDISLNFNTTKAKKSNTFTKLIQGVLFAKMNYFIFNERVSKANEVLTILSNIDKGEWSNIKPFDSPEYGAIVMKTVNREKSVDTLFAIGSWVGTSQILMQSFTSNSKIIIHGKKLIYCLDKYKNIGLSYDQLQVINSLRILAKNYALLIDKYLKAMKNKTPLNLIEDELFLQLKTKNFKIYETIIK
jgi:hypothetical protein